MRGVRVRSGVRVAVGVGGVGCGGVWKVEGCGGGGCEGCALY